MSNNKDRFGTSKYKASFASWTIMHEAPKNIELKNEYEAIYTCIETIKNSKLKKMNELKLILLPIGKYTTNGKMIKSYAYEGKKIPIVITLHKGMLKSYMKKRYSSSIALRANNYDHYNYCELKFTEKIYTYVMEKIYSKYDEEMKNTVSWYACTMDQYIFQQKRYTKKLCGNITQKEQGKILEKLLSMKVEELSELNLSSYLEKIRMSFLEFERMYTERNSL